MRNGIAIALATGKNSQAVTMSFQKEYAERYDLPYRISGKCPCYRMELPFPARHDPDVLFFYAYGF